MGAFQHDLLKAFRKAFGYKRALESDAAVRGWLHKFDGIFGHYINGRWVKNGKTFATTCPATGEVLAHVAYGTKTHVDAACRAAAAAFPWWSTLSGFERAQYIYAIARAIARHSRLFAVLEALDNGKTVRETRDIDVPLAIRHLYHHAGWARILPNMPEFAGMKPGGVIGAIIPWNFPLLMAIWMIAPALASGNTIVLKPAEYTPLTAALLAWILQEEVGLPPGVVNIVFGDGQTGAHLVSHEIPWKIEFTGSTQVGQEIRRITAGSGKHLKMELGGKSPFIVCADADLDSAVEGVVNAIWFNQGQVCCAGSRLIVHEAVYQKFMRKLRARVRKLRGGHPLDKTVDLGAVNSQAQFDKIQRLLAVGVAEGARMWQPEEFTCPKDGWYVPPTIFDGVEPSMVIAQEEIFGPVLVVMPFSTISEAITLANNTPYGLAASVWSQDADTLGALGTGIKAGVVWMNTTNAFDAAAPFGGCRMSGWGRQGGKDGMLEMFVPGEWKCRKRRALPASAHRPIHRKKGRTARQEKRVDRTHRFLIGSGLKRPDGGASFHQYSPSGRLVCVPGDSQRKDERDAVVAARKAAPGWAAASAHLRAQILYFMAENLDAQRDRFAHAIHEQTDRSAASAREEVRLAVERLFWYAAWADKFGGEVCSVPGQQLVVAVKEPIGVLAVRAPDDWPLLGFVNAVAAALAMGDTVVVVAGQYALSALDFAQVVQNSDVPAGVLNILSAENPDAVAKRLAAHEDVDALWHFGTSPDAVAAIEAEALHNMKRVWAEHQIDWMGKGGESMAFLQQATQVKTMWLPFGV